MNSSKNILARFSLLLVLLIPVSVQAHPGHGVTGMEQGLAHPFSGLDHLLAMLAIGLWAAQLGGARRWAVPALFVGVMTLAGGMGLSGVALPGVEHGIAASVMILGLVIAFAVRPPMALTLGMVASFAVFHGFAHGAEMAAGSSAVAYSAGFVASTALLHACGFGLGLALVRAARVAPWLRLAGGGIALAGLALSVA
ncbi:MAG: HupE/UreJ family protein [Verrucomicrobiales bacterium]|nr:HupE/UreJ family protein [Verrucomicrobiales bacterium]